MQPVCQSLKSRYDWYASLLLLSKWTRNGVRGVLAEQCTNLQRALQTDGPWQLAGNLPSEKH